MFLVRTVFGEATAATFSENVGREWQRQGGSTGKARHTHGVSTWPARHAWPRAVACIVRCARGKCVVRAYNVLTTCLQRTVSVRLPRYLTEAVLTRTYVILLTYGVLTHSHVVSACTYEELGESGYVELYRTTFPFSLEVPAAAASSRCRPFHRRDSGF